MELRNTDRTGYVDEIVFVARLPSELVGPQDAVDRISEEE
jgi:hypothetical protein